MSKRWSRNVNKLNTIVKVEKTWNVNNRYKMVTTNLIYNFKNKAKMSRVTSKCWEKGWNVKNKAEVSFWELNWSVEKCWMLSLMTVADKTAKYNKVKYDTDEQQLC